MSILGWMNVGDMVSALIGATALMIGVRASRAAEKANVIAKELLALEESRAEREVRLDAPNLDMKLMLGSEVVGRHLNIHLRNIGRVQALVTSIEAQLTSGAWVSIAKPPRGLLIPADGVFHDPIMVWRGELDQHVPGWPEALTGALRIITSDGTTFQSDEDHIFHLDIIKFFHWETADDDSRS